MSWSDLRRNAVTSARDLKGHLLTASTMSVLCVWWNPAVAADDRAVFVAVPLLLLVVAFRVVLPLRFSTVTASEKALGSSANFRGWDRVGYLTLRGAVMAAFLAVGFLLALPFYVALDMTIVVWDAFVMSILLVAAAAVACLMTAAAVSISVMSRSTDEILDHFRSVIWPALAAVAFKH